MIALIVTATWVIGPWVLFPIVIAGGTWYNRRHQPPAWNDADSEWAAQQGITAPGSETTP